MRRATAAVVAGAGIVMLALASNCFVEGFVRVEPTPAGQPSDAGTGGGGGADADPGCRHATWPSPPDQSDPGSDTVDVLLAITMMDFGEVGAGEDGPRVGYDLDARCTCQGEGPSCNPPDWATADSCDGPEGRDNAWALLFEGAGVFDANLTSEALTRQIQEGRFTMLTRVSSYNGRPNDDNVTLALYACPGREHDPCAPADWAPDWDGNDRWPVLASSLMGSGGSGYGGGVPADCSSGAYVPPGYSLDEPRFVDANAYVTDSVLVASLPSVELVLSSEYGGSDVKLTAGFLTGRLEQDGSTQRWTMREGLLVGRWKVEDVFRSLSTMAIGSQGLVCADHPLFPPVKSAVCAFPEIASTLGGPTTPCDAISFGMAFEATEAQFGSVVVSSGSASPCPPETDIANQTCE